MATPPADGDLDRLLAYLRDQRGFDFTGYKRASLTRRIARRMQAVGASGYAEYLDLLEANPGEFADLFNTILINVTGFLRDREAWDYLAADVIPQILGSKAPSDSVRIWSAGCSSGEEAYSLAVLFAEAAGEESFRNNVKIYATDADEQALTQARHGRYPIRSLLQAFGNQRVERFFETDGTTGVFRPELRHSLIFGRHDLVQDPPISRIDLLVCRNTLMYFTADTQRRILTAFHFALSQEGYLFLGKSEALVRRSELFQSLDPRQHVFRKDGKSRQNHPQYPAIPARTQKSIREPARPYAESAFDMSAVAQLVVNRNGELVLANRQARNLFGIGMAEVGRPFRNLEASSRPVDLRAPVEQVLRDRRPLTLGDVLWERSGDERYFEVTIAPLDDFSTNAVSVSFIDVGRYHLLRSELERSQAELESAYEELQSTVEELETTNEELQSTNEELETTNEELHSTNEELETMNEELQSTNEELETINNELRLRTSQLDDVNQFLESILSSLQSGVVVLNTDLHVREWNRVAEDLWGLRRDEVEGEHFLNLDIGLPVDQLRAPIRAVLAGSEHEHLVLAAVNRRGRSIRCDVNMSPLVADGHTVGVILLMDAIPNAEAQSDSAGSGPTGTAPAAGTGPAPGDATDD